MPQGPLSTGSLVSVICRAGNATPDTQLIWYRGDRIVDTSYLYIDSYVTNDYSFTVSESDSTDLKCRLNHPPSNTTYITTANYQLKGLITDPFLANHMISIASNFNKL